MGNMTPIIVAENNNGILGVFVILVVVFIVYTIASIYINNIRYQKLLYAKQLIEEGHKRKEEGVMMDEAEE